MTTRQAICHLESFGKAQGKLRERSCVPSSRIDSGASTPIRCAPTETGMILALFIIAHTITSISGNTIQPMLWGFYENSSDFLDPYSAGCRR